MLKSILAGTTALALVIAFAGDASANPKNKFGDNNTAEATALADANANGGNAGDGGGANANGGANLPGGTAGTAGAGGAGGAGGTATAYAESFNSDIEVISVQEMTATVNGAPIPVFGGIGGAGGNGANGDRKRVV